MTLGELVPKYLAARHEVLRPKSYVENQRYLEASWKRVHNRTIDEITRTDVVEIINNVERDSGKVSADRARAALSALFDWAIDLGYASANPTIHIRARAKSGSRMRVLTEAELVEVWNTCLARPRKTLGWRTPAEAFDAATKLVTR